MAVDVVVVNYKTPDLLDAFCKSYEEHTFEGCTLTVVDVTLDSPYPEQIAFRTNANFVRFTENVGYGQACNAGALWGVNDVILLANADTLLTSDFQECYTALVVSSVWGVLGPRQVNEHNQITAGGVFGRPRAPQQRAWMEPDKGQCNDIREDALTVSGAFYFVKRNVWEDLTSCPIFQEFQPDSCGAFMEGTHYYEETLCVPKGEWIWTSDGPQQVEDVVSGGSVWSYDSSVGSIVTAGVSWAGETGVKECVRLNSAKGRAVSVSVDHELPVVVSHHRNLESGELIWKKAKDVQVGDYILKVLQAPINGETKIPDGVTVEAMQFFGCYLGDGTHDLRSITMALPEQDRCRTFYEELSKKVFHKKTRWTRRCASSCEEEVGEITIQPVYNAFRFSTVDGVHWLESLGFFGRAWEKSIPGWVYGTPLSYRLGLLAGLVDSDGSINKEGQLIFGLTSRELIEGIAQLLVSCGLPVGSVQFVDGGKESTFPQGYTSINRDHWRVMCSDPGIIPFSDDLYRTRLSTKFRRTGRTLATTVGLDRSLGVARVSKIEPLGELPVYDLSVPTTSTFIVSGVPVHNCSYHARAHGYKCVYYGMAKMIHLFHKASEPGGWADQQMVPMREKFREFCRAHEIECE